MNKQISKIPFVAICAWLFVQSACLREKDQNFKGDVPRAKDYMSITNNGAWCWFSDPRAVYFEGKHKRTYAGWITSEGDVTIGYYDHETGNTSAFVLYAELEVDDHDNPALQIDGDGFLRIYFSKHGPAFPIQLYRSTRNEDITEWHEPIALKLNDMEAYAGLRDTYTYQNPVYLSDEDRYFLFWRGADNKPNFANSEDGASTWSKGKIFILPERTYKNRRPYLKVSSNGKDKIHFAFTDGHPNVEEENSIYYMYYKEGRLFTAAGNPITSLGEEPVVPRSASVVYDATQKGKAKSWIWDVAADDSGQPVVAYAILENDTTHIYCIAKWNGSAWEHHDLVNSGGYFPEDTPGETQREKEYSGGMAIDHEDPDIVYVSVRRSGIFEIEKWTLDPDRRGWHVTPVTHGSTKNNVRPFAVRNARDNNPIQVLWMHLDHYRHYTDYAAAIKTNWLEDQ
jgi:hypothetical protein